jgi:hypothetical protein
MSTPQVFAREMVVRAEQVEDAVAFIKSEAAKVIAKEVVNNTPVDTSQALSNWQGSVGAPKSGTLKAYVPGKLGSTATASGLAAISNINLSIKGAEVEQDIWLSNNLDYAVKLNQGRIQPRSPSNRSPDIIRAPYERFVELAILRGSLSVLQNARKIFK